MKNEKRTVTTTTIKEDQLLECVYDADKQETNFVALEDGEITKHNNYQTDKTNYQTVSPFCAFLEKRGTLLPSDAIVYGTYEELVHEVHTFIHKYLHVSKEFETISTYYVIMTWVYDHFHAIPYLRAVGDMGTGKSRFLDTIGSIVYKPYITSGATSNASIFRTLDELKGTLVLDEADRRFSDKTDDLIKILNHGYTKHGKIERVEGKSVFEVKFYEIFGPKVIGMRERFSDNALESRCITEYMRENKDRPEIPADLGKEFNKEAGILRNKLLYWRLENQKKEFDGEVPELINISSRLRQITKPLFQLMNDTAAKKQLVDFITEYHSKMVEDSKSTPEYLVFISLMAVIESGKKTITLKDLIDDCTYSDSGISMSAKRIGYILGNILNIRKRRTGIGYVIDPQVNYKQIEFLKNRFSYSVDELSEHGELEKDTQATDQNGYIKDEDNPFENNLKNW